MLNVARHLRLLGLLTTLFAAVIGIAFLVPSGSEASHTGGFFYTVEQSGAGLPEQIVTPLVNADTVANFYNLVGISSNNTGLQKSNVSNLWLYEDSNTGVVSLGMIHDKRNDSGGGGADFTFGGVPAGTTFVVRDDNQPTEAVLPASIWSWASCCTDGGVLSGTLQNATWAITIDSVFPTAGGIGSGKIASWEYLDGPAAVNTNPIALALTTSADPTKQVIIRSRKLDDDDDDDDGDDDN